MIDAKKRIDRIEKQINTKSGNRVDSWRLDGLTDFVQAYDAIESGELILTDQEAARLHERFKDLIDGPGRRG